MTENIPPPLLERFSHFLAARMGLHFPPGRWPDLVRGLRRAAPEFGFAAAGPCLQWLLASDLTRPQVEILASHLSVGETYFFRDPGILAALENDILPPLIAARRAAGRRLRIWSAGCCTGEEPYTLAILLTRLIPDLEDWHITILGTDINPQFLAKATRGVYREWSFRGTPAAFKGDCFDQPEPGRFALQPRFRRLVNFEYLNLVDDLYPSLENNTSAMDIVFCRNVLLYFETATAEAVVGKLRRSLADDGWLVVSPTEASRPIYGGFSPVGFTGAMLFRKVAGGLPAAAGPLAPAAPRGRPAPSARPASAIRRPPAPAAAPARPAPRPPPAASPYETALACYGQGRYQEAVDRLAGADDPRSLALLARAGANLGRLADAFGWCQAAVQADKLNPGLRYLLASILEEKGRYEEAAAALKQALYLDQGFVLAHYALGNLYRRQGQPDKAARHFASATELLGAYPADAPLPDSEGFTAGRLLEIINAMEGIA